jgi:hypothetical protein
MLQIPLYYIVKFQRSYNQFETSHFLKEQTGIMMTIYTIAFNWFLGENHLNQIIYNPVTGGCYDGLEEHQVNLNQGAESTLSYLLARLTIEKYSSKLKHKK